MSSDAPELIEPAPTTAGPRLLCSILGHETEAEIAAALHHLRHHGAVEYLRLTAPDLERRRLRVRSDGGTEYAIVLPRDQALTDGAVLALDDHGAVVVRAGTRRTLTFRATTVQSGLRLGFLAGHLHWASSFDGDQVTVTVEGADSDYLDRVADLIASREVTPVERTFAGPDVTA
ncbi:hypothetical protein [Raineyella sp. LH-20]|uniref:hypothetical protein n=1 Tax=Raineyella sp. LH-20 TaxID=3081204 RepID=UPI0029545A56|nr:hypothetical protein [Raineyella sp. LH-20]WOP19934.1 hypothetical protein R0146_06575 [Raineyella sp. LH-20]